MRICIQTNGKLTEADRLQLATLLIKAGYTVRLDKVQIDGKAVQVVETVD